jgi:hypothetical protein
MNKEIHCGNFSSSDIVRLCGTKKVRETYIQEKNIERKLGRVLKNDFSSKDTSWGHLMEIRAFSLLGTEYSLVSNETIPHPKVKGWVGSPDALKYVEKKKDTVCDIKGLQLKNFCTMVDAFELGGIQKVREVCDDGDKFYYQIVSNACITLCNYGELILYCPYQSELDAIRKLSGDYDGPDAWRFKRFQFAEDGELPYLIDGGYYKNLNAFRFEIPLKDKLFVHDRVVEATKELIEIKNPVTA